MEAGDPGLVRVMVRDGTGSPMSGSPRPARPGRPLRGAAEAARRRRDAFGFEPAGNIPDTDSGEQGWIELHVGSSALMVFKLPDGPTGDGPARHAPWIFVDDLDAHYAREGRRRDHH